MKQNKTLLIIIKSSQSARIYLCAGYLAEFAKTIEPIGPWRQFGLANGVLLQAL